MWIEVAQSSILFFFSLIRREENLNLNLIRGTPLLNLLNLLLQKYDQFMIQLQYS